MKIKKAWMAIGALGLISIPILANIGTFTKTNNNTNIYEYMQQTRTQSSGVDVKTTTQAIEQNLEINFSDAKYDDFENSPINLDPWKQLVGPSSVLNIKSEIIDLTSATSAKEFSIPVMLTEIDKTTGNLKQPIITSIDFWDGEKFFCGQGPDDKPRIGGQTISKLYYSGGIYSETLNKFLVVVQAKVNDTWRPMLIKIDPNSGDGASVTFDYVLNRDQLMTTTTKASTTSSEGTSISESYYMYIQRDIPFEYNVVPFANLTNIEQKQFDGINETTYLNSSFFLVPWDVDYKLLNYFPKEGTLKQTSSGTRYTTDIFQTAFTIDPSNASKIIWQPQLLHNQDYADYIGAYGYNDKILACRPIFFSYDNSEANLSSSLNLIKLSGAQVNIDIVTGAGPNYGRDLIQYYANYYRIEKDTGQKSKTLTWNPTTFDRLSLKTRPMIEVFKLDPANISSEITNAWMISFGFLNNVDDNDNKSADASLLFNNIYVTKINAQDIKSSIYATNPAELTYSLNGWNKTLMSSLWFDYKNKRITFFAKLLSMENLIYGVWETTSTLITLDYSYFMSFSNNSGITFGNNQVINFADDISNSSYIFTKYIWDNIVDYELYYDNLGPDFKNTETVVIPFVGSDQVSYYNPSTKNLTLTKTFMNQLANDVATQQSSFSVLSNTQKVEDITTDQIVNEIKTGSVFKITNVPSKLINLNNGNTPYTYDEIIQSFMDKITSESIKITSTPEEVANGTLRFQISYDGLIFNNGFNTIQNTNPLVNQANMTNQEFIIYGFKQETPTIINEDIIMIDGVSNDLANTYTQEQAQELITVTKKENIFINLPKDTTITLNPLDYSNEYNGEIIVTGSIDKYYDENGILKNEPKEFTITLTGFKKYTTTWIDTITITGYENQFVNDLDNDVLAKIIDANKTEIFEQLPIEPTPTFVVEKFDTVNAFNGQTKVDFVIQQAYVDGVLTNVEASITLTGFKKYTTTWVEQYQVNGYSDKLTTDVTREELEKIISDNVTTIFDYLPIDPMPTITIDTFDNQSLVDEGKIIVNLIITNGYINGELTEIKPSIVISGFKKDTSIITTIINSPADLSNVSHIEAANVEDNNSEVINAIIAANIIMNPVIGETITISDIEYTIISRIGKEGQITVNITIKNSKAWIDKVPQSSMVFENIVLNGFGKTSPSVIPNTDPTQPEKPLEISTDQNLDNLDPIKIQDIIKNETNISGLPNGSEPKIDISTPGSNKGTDFTITIDQYYDSNGNLAGPLVINGSISSSYKSDTTINTNNDEMYWWIPLIAALGGFALILFLWIIIFTIVKKRRGEY